MRLNSNMKGAALMTACVSAYVINDAFMKLLFSEIALFQAVFLRSIITVPPILIIVWTHQSGDTQSFKTGSASHISACGC